MSPDPKLSHTAAMILQAVHVGCAYGFSVMEQTGLPSGSVYPALRRLERDGLIHSEWEDQALADEGLRPARKYYTLTKPGLASMEFLYKRYPLLARLAPTPELKYR